MTHPDPVGQKIREAFSALDDLVQCNTADASAPRSHPGVPTSCTGRTITAVNRDEALMNYYSAERRAGASALEANERMHFFAKRLDEELERK